MNTPSNSIMNAFGMDALARAAMEKDLRKYDAISLSGSTLLNTCDTKLIAPNLLMAKAPARRESIPMVSSCSPVNARDLSSGRAINNNNICPSILNGQQPPSGINSVAANDGSQAQPAAADPGADYASMMQSRFESTVTAPSRRRKPNFAEKLHAVLSSSECAHAVSWLPSGRSFCITDQDEFVKSILPKFFREAKFESFSRRLKRWGFRKVYTTGLSQIIFSHDLFHRDRPDLCKIMNGREKVAPGQKKDQSMPGSASATGAFSVQDPCRNVTMFQQAQAQQQQLQRRASFQQQMAMLQQMGQRSTMLDIVQPQGRAPSRVGSVQNSVQSVQSLTTLQGPSPVDVDAQAMMRKANALVATSMPQVSQLNPEDLHTIYQAKIQLNRLNDDIANCEEQLAILQRLKGLKETHRQLAGDCTPRQVSPSSV